MGVEICDGTRISGDVQVSRGTGPAQALSLGAGSDDRCLTSPPPVTILGQVKSEMNFGSTEILAADLRQNAQILNNRGFVRVERNTIGGNLQCFGNTDGLFAAGNVVAGNAEGQCAGAEGPL